MHIVSFVVFGLSVGALARLIVPGNAPGGFLASMAVGIMGAFIGGFLGRALGAYSSYESPSGMIASTLGAIALIALWQPVILRRHVTPR